METNKAYSSLILKSINDLETSNAFYDITLQVEGRKFQCHKFILAATSPYFHAMFTTNMKEAKKNAIQLPFLNAETFQTIRHFIYTGQLQKLTSSEVLDLLEAADFLQMVLLQKECENLIKQMYPSMNKLQIWRLGKKISAELEQHVFAYICGHLQEVMSDSDFIDIGVEELKEILNSEQLILASEDIASEIILSWLDEPFETRKKSLDEILPLLRLPLTSGEYLCRAETRFSDIINLPKFQPLFVEAQNYHKLPARQADFCSISTRQRPSSVFKDVIIVVNGSSDISALTLDTLTWHPLSQIPRDKGKDFSICTYGNSTLLLSGGTRNSRPILRYSGTTNKWNVHTQHSSSNTTFKSLTRHATISYGDSIYTFGGEVIEDYVEVQCKNVHCWNITKDDWSVAGELTVDVHSPTVAMTGSKVHIVGKTSDDDGERNVVQCYDMLYGCTIVCCNPDISGLETVLGFNHDLYGILDGQICNLTLGPVMGGIKSAQKIGVGLDDLMLPYAARKIGNRIIVIRSMKNSVTEETRNELALFNTVTKQWYVGSSTNSNLNSLQPMCFKIVVKRCFLGPGVPNMFSE